MRLEVLLVTSPASLSPSFVGLAPCGAPFWRVVSLGSFALRSCYSLPVLRRCGPFLVVRCKRTLASYPTQSWLCTYILIDRRRTRWQESRCRVPRGGAVARTSTWMYSVILCVIRRVMTFKRFSTSGRQQCRFRRVARSSWSNTARVSVDDLAKKLCWPSAWVAHVVNFQKLPLSSPASSLFFASFFAVPGFPSLAPIHVSSYSILFALALYRSAFRCWILVRGIVVEVWV